MAQDYRIPLRDNRDYLVKHVHDMTAILRELEREKILTEDMRKAIEVKPTRVARFSALLDILPKGGSEALEEFLHILVRTDHGACAVLLHPTIRKQIVRLRAEEGMGVIRP